MKKVTEPPACACQIGCLTGVATNDEQVTEPPATPTGLAAVATNDQVVLTWNDPGDDSITGYRILRRMRRGGNYGTWARW